MKTMSPLRANRAFSLIELMIVVAIIGLLAAIAIPRMSRASQGAVDARLKADLSVMRNAIELYAAEHNGLFPTAANWEAQMVEEFSDIDGNTNATKGGDFIYGPYLKSTPVLQVGANKGSAVVANDANAGTAWTYDPTTGDISANTGTLTDDSGTLYSDY